MVAALYAYVPLIVVVYVTQVDTSSFVCPETSRATSSSFARNRLHWSSVWNRPKETLTR
jgi:hypothetical protein